MMGWKEEELRDVIYQSSHTTAVIDNKHLKSRASLPYSIKTEHQQSDDDAVNWSYFFKENMLVRIEHRYFTTHKIPYY